ncbi:MAG: hypothetical protein PHT88_04665 [Candidatus Moranbacteria bacterium]|nr:hypothetical protein [Candidatus Moranbacteria bacterium]
MPSALIAANAFLPGLALGLWLPAWYGVDCRSDGLDAPALLEIAAMLAVAVGVWTGLRR